jgi:predicted PurR-regulated permease PerM
MLFGAAGLILGPMILSITQVLLEIWSARTRPAATAGTDGDPEASAPVAS